MNIEDAMKVLRAAGYRVSKPKPKKLDRVGPTCAVTFADGIVCRMTTHCSDDKLDWSRGERLCVAAYEARTKHATLVPAIKQIAFERNGAVIEARQL